MTIICQTETQCWGYSQERRQIRSYILRTFFSSHFPRMKSTTTHFSQVLPYLLDYSNLVIYSAQEKEEQSLALSLWPSSLPLLFVCFCKIVFDCVALQIVSLLKNQMLLQEPLPRLYLPPFPQKLSICQYLRSCPFYGAMNKQASVHHSTKAHLHPPSQPLGIKLL